MQRSAWKKYNPLKPGAYKWRFGILTNQVWRIIAMEGGKMAIFM